MSHQPGNEDCDFRDFQTKEFIGRNPLVADLVATLIDPAADQQRKRSVILSAPAKRGKTWTLRRVEEVLYSHGNIAPCFYTGDDFQNQSAPAFPILSFDLLCPLWKKVHQLVPNLPWPKTILPQDTTEEQHQKLLAYLRGFPLAHLLEAIHTRTNNDHPDLLIVLILDGMDEIATDILHAFEREFVAPLFRHKRVRLLASRRIVNPSQSWSEFRPKLQTRHQDLEGFDSSREQIKRLLKNHGVSTNCAHFQAQMKTKYSWSNPGANHFLVRCASRHGGILEKACIEGCIRCLIQASRPLDPARLSLSDDDVILYIGLMVKQFSAIEKLGAARPDLNAIFGGVSDDQRDEFLNHFQERGIGYLGDQNNFIIHSDFVELFLELQKR